MDNSLWGRDFSCPSETATSQAAFNWFSKRSVRGTLSNVQVRPLNPGRVMRIYIVELDSKVTGRTCLPPDYIPINYPAVKFFAPEEETLCTYQGRVLENDGNTAFVRLRTPDGTFLNGEYPAAKFKGIGQGQPFRCLVKRRGKIPEIVIEPVPDDERLWKEVSERTERLFAEYNAKPDY